MHVYWIRLRMRVHAHQVSCLDAVSQPMLGRKVFLSGFFLRKGLFPRYIKAAATRYVVIEPISSYESWYNDIEP